MNRIAVATVIRGEGECEAFVNGVASDDIRRKQEKMRAETERACTVEASRNRLLARRLAALNKRINRRPSLFKRVVKPLEDAWVLFWAVMYCWPEMLINLCMEKGWLEVME